jgi:Cysteine-rich secretory protein family
VPALTRLAVLLIVSIAVLSQASGAQRRAATPEQALWQSANRSRAALKLPPLKWDTALAEAAQQHAQRLAQQNTLSHQLPGEPDLVARAARAGAHFSAIAENIAVAPGTAEIHAEWMASAPHRANLLDPNLDSVGIAISQRGGRFFAVEDFSRAVVNLTFEQEEQQAGALLVARGLRLLSDPTDARRACAQARGFTATARPRSVFRYETDDPGQLPDKLDQGAQSGRYHSAAVGACSSGQSAGFTIYRLAVLLY